MEKKLVLYETAKDKGAFNKKEDIAFVAETADVDVFDPTMHIRLKDNRAVNVYPEVEYQEILGFGGAMTEAAALNLKKLPEAKREEVLRGYFDSSQGIGYRYCRTHIGSSDFCEEMYDYVEKDDSELKSFSLEQDEKAIFPAIRQASVYAGGNIEVIATPWSPPAWMKTNGERCNGGKLKKEFYQAWAQYYVKYIQEARKEGIPVTTISVQNEPQAFVTWDSCIYDADEERDFIKLHLGPALRAAGLEDVKILIWDHNKDLIVNRVRAVMSDEEAAQYVWGAAFHWYGGDHFYALDVVHALYPELKLFYTEGCHGGVHRKTGQWCSGEIIAHEIFGDLKHWTSACIDWNLVLDMEGGPSHAHNYCDAPVLCRADGTYQLESSYYYMGHFSRFLKPGAKRIGSSAYSSEIEECAFRNPDGSIVLVMMNRENEAKTVCIRCRGNLAFLELAPHSIVTAVW